MGSSREDENSSGNLLSFITGALVGGAIGTVLGIFLAPKSGTEMRYQLSEGVHDAQLKTKQLLGDTKSTLGQSVDKATKNLESTVQRVTEAFNAGRKAAKESVTNEDTSESETSNKVTDTKISDKIDKSDIISDKIDKSEKQDIKSDKIANEKNQDAAKIGDDVAKKNKAE